VSREQDLFSTAHDAQFGVLSCCLRDKDKVAFPEPAPTVAVTELQYVGLHGSRRLGGRDPAHLNKCTVPPSVLTWLDYEVESSRDWPS